MNDYKLTEENNSFPMPYSTEAEQATLGAILFDPECLDKIIAIIGIPDYFYIKIHKLTYEAMIELFTMGKHIDVVTLLDRLEEEEACKQLDVKNYLLELAEFVPSISSVETYANIVKEKYKIRTLIETSKEIIDYASKGTDRAENILDLAEQKIFNIRRGKDLSGLVHIKETLIETFDRLDELNSESSEDYKGIPTGIGAIDDTIMGLNKSDLILLAARPGMGKTSFALNIASNAAIKREKKIAFFSLEMTKEQLTARLLSSIGQVSGMKLKTGNLNEEEWVRLVEAGDILAKTAIYLDDTSNITVPQMKAKLRRINNVDLVIVDYLQLMTAGQRIENRVQEVSSITRNLKIMAKELNIPVVTLSQLSRASEQRAQHRPVLSDLRDSGSIEQDADIVMFLYRPDYYGESNKSEEELSAEDRNKGECIIAKNRHGEIRNVPLHWQGEYMRFTAQEGNISEY